MVTSAPGTPPPGEGENVVYLTEEHGIQPGPPRGVVPPNAHAGEYERGEVGAVEPPAPAGPQLAPVPHSHGELPTPEALVPPERDEDNPYGNFFADGPSAWLEDDDEDDVPIETPRIAGTLLVLAAIGSGIAAWTIWGIAMYRGFGGAEAGAALLASMLLWLWYLTLPRSKQHAAMLRWHERIRSLVERRTSPLSERTEGTLSMRRERSRYRAMRDERTRRINALGESAYREFRQGRLPAALQQHAQRVLGMERQMLIQDHRIHLLQLERQRSRGGQNEGSDRAAPPRQGGQSDR